MIDAGGEMLRTGRFTIAVLAVLWLASAPVFAQPRTGQDVIRAMHDKYAGAWYPTVTFVQNVVYADGRPAQDMWEALKVPARLRIDVGPIDAPSRTIVYRDETRVIFDKGKLTSTTRSPNLLLVLGFDVYGQAPETTVKLLQTEGFDLSKVHEDTWEGRPAFVVGAAAGDLSTPQFWIEKERLIFLRLIQKNQAGATSDIRFTKYEPLGRGWIGTVVVFNTDGKETFREVYRDWKINPAVTDALFDATEWKPPAWVK
jgi:outer membrane lipoprotein-sorting protein